MGLPNVGKSTLFNALLKKRVALSANYPFSTVEPNVGVVAVVDERLEKLAELVAREEGDPSTSLRMNMPPIVPAAVQFVDIAGLVKNANIGEGLGNQFLSHIREVDAIIHVLRDFSDENVARAGSVDPESDKEVVETELALADLQTLEKLNLKTQNEPVRKLYQALSQGRQARDIPLTGEERETIKGFGLLTIKPVLYVYNVLENEYKNRTDEYNLNSNELIICAKLEEELVDLEEGERVEYLKSLGVTQTGLERLITAAYKLLELISFFTTTGKKEVRAWTIKFGTKALQAAGVIHTDFAKNFIKAQVIEYNKLIEAGSYGEAKEKGWIRTEGKDYMVSDGDVIEFLVS